MAIISQPTLYDVILKNSSVIPILNRLGIRLGVGEMTLAEAAKAAGIAEEDMPLVKLLICTGGNPKTAITQTAMVKEVKRTPFAEEYFSKSTAYFKTVQLPNIEKHLNAFIGMSMGTDTAKGQLVQLSNLLDEFCRIMSNAFDLLELKGVREAEELLAEMQLVMIKYLKGNFNDNLCYATIFALGSLETGIATHRRIISALLPDKKSVSRAVAGNTAAEAEGILTPRETEVLVLVAQGKINKEIADILNISFQTVLSHRKNISAKLGIKTVAGLTIYAIKAGLVEL